MFCEVCVHPGDTSYKKNEQSKPKGRQIKIE